MGTVIRRKNIAAAGESLEYVYKKAKNTFPPYLAALCLTFAVSLLNAPPSGIGEALSRLFHYKWEFFYLQMLGVMPHPAFGADYLMGSGWYLSSMFIALIFIYYAARSRTKAFLGALAPAAVLF